MVVLDLTLSPMLAIVVRSPELSNAAIVTKNQSAALIGSFWHESSATEPGGTARNGRARQPGAANIAAMPVAGSVTLFALPPAGRAQRGRSRDHGADRSAVSGPALLRVAPDGGMAGDPRPCRQPQAGAAPDAAARAGGDRRAFPCFPSWLGKRGKHSRSATPIFIFNLVVWIPIGLMITLYF